MHEVNFLADFACRLLVHVHVGALETVDGLLGVAYHEVQEHIAEDIPLQLVRVLEFVDDGVGVLRAESFLERTAGLHDSLVDRKNHVVERLQLVFGLVCLPCVEKLRRMGNKELVELDLFNLLVDVGKESLEFL